MTELERQLTAALEKLSGQFETAQQQHSEQVEALIDEETHEAVFTCAPRCRDGLRRLRTRRRRSPKRIVGIASLSWRNEFNSGDHRRPPR